MKGKLIAFEGCDGSGLSTQAALASKWLRKKGYDVLETKEPTNNFIGQVIRSILKKETKTDQKTLQLLFCADRAHHLGSEIIPALETGKMVITDRYTMSTLAFGSLDLEADWLKKLNEKFPRPDLTIIIDVPEKVSVERIVKSRPKTELFEEVKKLGNVRKSYHELSKEFPNTVIIDGTKSIENVFIEVENAITALLRQNKG